MDNVLGLLRDYPLLLLFVVLALGYPLGKIQIAGARLGGVSILFSGLAVGALQPDLQIPVLISNLGLVLFVYTIGINSGSSWLSSFRKQGWLYNVLVAGTLILTTGLIIVTSLFLKMDASLASGLFSGSLTNAAALAASLEWIRNNLLFPSDSISYLPVITFAFTYPGGVAGMVLVMSIIKRVLKVNAQTDSLALRDIPSLNATLYTRTIRITQTHTMTVAEFMRRHNLNIIFGRIRSGNEDFLATGKSVLRHNDLVTLIGTQAGIEAATNNLGEESDKQLELDLTHYEQKNLLISNSHVAGRSLRDLDLVSRFGSMVIRLRRGDIEMLPHGDTVLNLGDQIMVIAPHNQMSALSALLGDSVRTVSEVDLFTLSLGLGLGFVFGLAPIALPGGITFTLGLASGPLLVALILGAAGRTGPFVWSLPYNINLTLRQVGLSLFLAGIGVNAGNIFVSSIFQPVFLIIILIGFGITCLSSLFVLLIGYKIFHIPLGVLFGIAAGMQTQPATLGYSLDQTQNELPNIGYTTVYPVAVVLKVILVQILFLILSP